MRPVVLPVGALVVVVGAQEIVHALLAMPHVAVGAARRVVPLIVLAGPAQRCELVVHLAQSGRRHCLEARPRTAAAAARRTARSSTPPSETRRAAAARTTRPPASRSRGRSRVRTCPMPSAASRPTASRTRLSMRNEPQVAVVVRRPSRWCARSRAGRARSRGSPRRPAPAAHGASCTRVRESRAAAARSAGPACSKPASSTCIVRPLTPSTKRLRTPCGSTSGLSGCGCGSIALAVILRQADDLAGNRPAATASSESSATLQRPRVPTMHATTVPLTARSSRALPVTWAMLGTFVITFDFFAINVAVPSLRDALAADSVQLQWVVAAFGLMFGSGLIAGARLGDRHGAERRARGRHGVVRAGEPGGRSGVRARLADRCARVRRAWPPR